MEKSGQSSKLSEDSTEGHYTMALEIEYLCRHCGKYVSWVYNEDEDDLQSDRMMGCPGGECTEIHEISVRKIDDDKS